MKKCTLCKIYKPLTEFNKNICRKDGFQTVCRECNKNRSKRYYKENREKHLSVIKKRKKEAILRNRKYINNIKSKSKCFICGEDEICCLDFHHKNGVKEYCISGMGDSSIELIQKEIDKCILVCSNCHRKIHSNLICL